MLERAIAQLYISTKTHSNSRMSIINIQILKSLSVISNIWIERSTFFAMKLKIFFSCQTPQYAKKCIIMYFILVMHFRVSEIEPKYYADGEDAYAMRRNLGEFREKVRASIFFYLHFFLHQNSANMLNFFFIGDIFILILTSCIFFVWVSSLHIINT